MLKVSVDIDFQVPLAIVGWICWFGFRLHQRFDAFFRSFELKELVVGKGGCFHKRQ